MFYYCCFSTLLYNYNEGPENQVVVEINGTHQILLCVTEFHICGKSYRKFAEIWRMGRAKLTEK
jgi:hypothetical protein